MDNGARVINMSWGDPRGAPVLRDVIRYAERADVVLVAAAGNEGEDAVFYPARFSQTIAVGASTPEGQVLAFSNYGPSIELVAPGQAILSLFPGGTYGPRSGTSMAAPHVAGLAALLLGRKPAWTAERVRAALRFSSKDLLVGGWDPYSGAGSCSECGPWIERSATGSRFSFPSRMACTKGIVLGIPHGL